MYNDDDYESDFEKYVKKHPSVIRPFSRGVFSLLDNSIAQLHTDDTVNDIISSPADIVTVNECCDLKDCRINRSLTASLLLKEEQLRKERLKVRLHKDKRVRHQKKQEAAEGSLAFLEQRIRVLENRVAEMQVRNTNLAYTIGNLERDKEGLVRNLFERTIGFPPEMSQDEMSLIIDALVYYCVELDHDADALVSKYEMWNWNEDIKNSLYAILSEYSEHI